MGKEMGVSTRNLYELDTLVTGLEETVTELQKRIAWLEAWAMGHDPEASPAPLASVPDQVVRVDPPPGETHP